jgi:hypothetical protein
MTSPRVADVVAHAAVRPAEPDARYVLITECLQNDFLLNRECRLYLGDDPVRGLLLRRDELLPAPQEPKLKLGRGIRSGPLGAFLEATVGARLKGKGAGMLHVINIRDWHVADDSYDLERRAYGAHCEAGTWGAGYVEGLEHLLDPAGSPDKVEAKDLARGSAVVHHVHSDSIFDFRPRAAAFGTAPQRFPQSRLEEIMDELVFANDDREAPPTYVAVIGLYSDIKILTLLAGLRTRYELPNLVVSDTLTASASLERHIAGLDFADKLLGVEVMHGLNDLVRFLGNDATIENEHELVSTDGFARYRSFFFEKQSVLAAESERLRSYLELTERRALDTYTWIKLANRFLLAWGSAFLLATLAFSCAKAAGVKLDWQIPAITGGVSLLQIVSAFYSKPIQDLQRNLANLAVFKMILESRSLKTALGRFHLTTPHVLRELQTPEEAETAKLQVALLQSQLALIEEYDRVDFEALANLGFGAEAPSANGSSGSRLRTPGRGRGQRSEDLHS